MDDEERLHKIVSYGLKEGFKKKHICDVLISKGYDKQIIEKSFKNYEKSLNKPENKTSRRKKPLNCVILYVIIIVLIILLGISLFFR